MKKSEYLLWRIPYTTARDKKCWFPAVKTTLEIERKEVNLAVDVSPHIQVEILMGNNIPHFRKYLREALEKEQNIKEETIEVPLEISRVGRVEEHSAKD